MQFARKQRHGFTVIELIVVIVLIATVSVIATSRYFGRSSYSAYTYQEAITSVIRQIQVNRMQSNLSANNPNSNYVLVVNSDCIGSVQGCALGSDGDYQRSDVIRSDNATFSLLGNPSSNQIEFDLKGNPSWSGSGDIKITIEAEGSTSALCINSQGYIQKDC
ncbi:type II secretion system protein [Vibrio hippocampi]|uniref:MSHA biogenesis protein MshC n=1 Tax=Vibrio hippocampi TaxID=654686 RepID=A0ABN8DL79_9VIBR|nr:prepilin-type N-terminal cleavage/methylation domain-containing protein [Vibrio hippocampi]CAH0526868.1 hypothetical protein VHP8226_02244 [Vibrio hippocampi]